MNHQLQLWIRPGAETKCNFRDQDFLNINRCIFLSLQCSDSAAASHPAKVKSSLMIMCRGCRVPHENRYMLAQAPVLNRKGSL